jgi:hypothetical protein
MSKVVHGETPQIVQAMLQAGQILFCWESKTAAPAKPNPLKDGDGKPRVSVISSDPCSKVFVAFPRDLRRRMAIEKNIKKSEKELQAA